MPEIWRTGRKVPIHLYRQVGPDPSDGDEPVGTMLRPEWATLAVEAVNLVSARMHQGVRVAPTDAGAWSIPAEPSPEVLAVRMTNGAIWQRRFAKDQPDRWAWGHWLLTWGEMIAWVPGTVLTDATGKTQGGGTGGTDA